MTSLGRPLLSGWSALMIHGGGYMTLSRKAIPPLQTSFLLRNGILPVSLDHR